MIRFARNHRRTLERFHLIATGTTGERLIQATKLDIDQRSPAYTGEIHTGKIVPVIVASAYIKTEGAGRPSHLC
ncbi:MAG TPA: hypothetical protein VNK95_14045 [Caldilineaceae bacterium]|nr:hypothetical protein [Caldilineaceae bacterium]